MDMAYKMHGNIFLCQYLLILVSLYRPEKYPFIIIIFLVWYLVIILRLRNSLLNIKDK